MPLFLTHFNLYERWNLSSGGGWWHFYFVLSADTSATAVFEGLVLSGISLTEEGITAKNMCIWNSDDFGCSKTTLKQGCLTSAWHSLLLLPEVM